jgi:aminocarboxymuconate-semialdehyde decarboxylase
MFVKSNTDPNMSEAAKQVVRERDAFIESRMSDTTDRMKRMDAMGVDIQVLSSSLVQQCTYWAEPQESLRMERMLNDRMAEVVAANPSRFIGLGGVPLHAPDLAVAELTRCMTELRLAGVGISTTARDMELGDRRLRPFWEAAEAHGAVVYIHPAGNTGSRFEKWYLWNSIGQAFEEAMATASLFYEGILDAIPNSRSASPTAAATCPITWAHRAELPDKPATRVNMSKSPPNICACSISTVASETEVLEALVKRVGADRVVCRLRLSRRRAQADRIRESCALSDEQKANIIGANAARLFGVKVAV